MNLTESAIELLSSVQTEGAILHFILVIGIFQSLVLIYLGIEEGRRGRPRIQTRDSSN